MLRRTTPLALSLLMLLAAAVATVPVASATGPCDDLPDMVCEDPWTRCVLEGGRLYVPDLSCCPAGSVCVKNAVLRLQ